MGTLLPTGTLSDTKSPSSKRKLCIANLCSHPLNVCACTHKHTLTHRHTHSLIYHTDTHRHAHRHTDTHAHTHILTYTHTEIFKHRYTHTQTLTHRHAHRHSYRHRCTHTQILTHRHTHSHTYSHRHTLIHRHVHRHSNKHRPINTQIHTDINTHTHSYTDMHSHRNMHIDSHTDVCAHIHYRHTHTQPLMWLPISQKQWDLENRDDLRDRKAHGIKIPLSTPYTIVPPLSTPYTIVPPLSTPYTIVPPLPTPYTIVPLFLLLTPLFPAWDTSGSNWGRHSLTLTQKTSRPENGWVIWLSGRAKPQGAAFEEHALPCHTFSSQNYWMQLQNETRLSQQFPSSPSPLPPKTDVIHYFNLNPFGLSQELAAFQNDCAKFSFLCWNLHFPFLVLTFLTMPSSPHPSQPLTADGGLLIIWETKDLRS